MLDEVTVQCPYCWESFATPVEATDVSHLLVVDCEICCQPIELAVAADGTVTVRREND